MCKVVLLTLLSCYKLKRCYIKLSFVNILEMVFVFIEILFKTLLFKGGVLIYAEHCIYATFSSVKQSKTMLHQTQAACQNTIEVSRVSGWRSRGLADRALDL